MKCIQRVQTLYAKLCYVEKSLPSLAIQYTVMAATVLLEYQINQF